MVISGQKKTSGLVKGLSWLLFAGFVGHTFGLGLRWYIAGHAPMSNGYESMIFISWATLLAGFIFSRKSAFALVSNSCSRVDDPYGCSYELYGSGDNKSCSGSEILLAYTACISYHKQLWISWCWCNSQSDNTLSFLSLSNDKNRERISDTIDELTVINFKTLTIGLYFLTIGTFLGAIWANESWGRYWGWDPKETWSLITIIVYSIVIHSRRIPGMKDIFTFNLISLFAFSSVLMTYFGVNYYLSGMHSYAAGEAAPVPVFVYVSVIALDGDFVLLHTRNINQRRMTP